MWGPRDWLAGAAVRRVFFWGVLYGFGVFGGVVCVFKGVLGCFRGV